jgi:hypothetical protein
VLRTITLIAAIGALCTALLAVPVGALIAGPVVTAWEVVPPPGADAGTVQTNREIWELGPPDWYAEGTPLDPSKPEQVAAVLGWYGNAGSEPQEFIWVDPSEVIHPPAMPELAIVLQDYSKGKRWKASFVWFFVPKVAGGAAVAGLLLLGVWFWLRRRAARGAAAGGDPPAATT